MATLPIDTRDICRALLCMIIVTSLPGKSYSQGHMSVVFDEFDRNAGRYPLDALNRTPLVHWQVRIDSDCVLLMNRVRGKIGSISHCPEVRVFIGNQLVKRVPARSESGTVSLGGLYRLPHNRSVALTYELKYPGAFSSRLHDEWECADDNNCRPPAANATAVEEAKRLDGKTIKRSGNRLNPSRTLLIASLGDFYAAGEGLPNFCGQKQSPAGHLLDTILELPLDVVDAPQDMLELLNEPSWRSLYDASQLSVPLAPVEYLRREQCLRLGAAMDRRPTWLLESAHRSHRASSFVVGDSLVREGWHGLKHRRFGRSWRPNRPAQGGYWDQRDRCTLHHHQRK
jgi:hypothetical protein